MKLSDRRADPDAVRSLVTLLAIVASIAVNTVTNILPINGLNIGEIANTLFAAVKFTPANYAFAIWGAIYIGLVVLGITDLQPNVRKNPRVRKAGYLLAIACISQCLWIYLFLGRQFSLSVVAMLGILIPLILMYQRLEIGTQRVSRQEQWCVQVPISLYLGWISVATILNIANAIYVYDGNNGFGFGATAWTIAMMVVSAALGAVVMWQRQDRVFTGVIAWALIAIAARQFAEPALVTVGSALGAGLIALMLFTPKRVNQE
jgi:hypothetical protein